MDTVVLGAGYVREQASAGAAEKQGLGQLGSLKELKLRILRQ